MSKKCIPGTLFCIENVTLFLLIVLLMCLILYFLYRVRMSRRPLSSSPSSSAPVPFLLPPVSTLGVGGLTLGKGDVFSDPYYPPLQDNIDSGVYYVSRGVQMIPPSVGVPVNVATQPMGTNFNQIGILTRAANKNGEMILPLFGRNLFSNRDKWQYYTISNTGNINSKLPINVQGKNGMSEYGVSELNNGDVIYVQGYNDIFFATLYDNRSLSYLPYL